MGKTDTAALKAAAGASPVSLGGKLPKRPSEGDQAVLEDMVYIFQHGRWTLMGAASKPRQPSCL